VASNFRNTFWHEIGDALRGFAVVSYWVIVTAGLTATHVWGSEPGTLHLRRGDMVQGSFVAVSSAREIGWRSPYFAEPLRFPLSAVDAIDFQRENESSRLAEREGGRERRARLELHDGTILYGELRAATDQHLVMDGRRHATVTIARRHVRRIQFVDQDEAVIFDGIRSPQGWVSLGTSEKRSDWGSQTSLLETTKYGANLYYDPDHRSATRADISLSGKGRPQFQIVVGIHTTVSVANQAFSIETWDSKLVLWRHARNEVELLPIKDLKTEDGNWTLNLEIYFDPTQQHVAVASGGRLLGEMKVSLPESLPGTGYLIRNRGDDLRVDQARFEVWKGPFHPVTDANGLDVVVRRDGTNLQGTFRSQRDQDALFEIVNEAGQAELVELDSVRQIELSAEATPDPKHAESSNVFVQYADGGVLSGTFLESTSEGVRLVPSFSAQPVLAGWEGVSEVKFKPRSEREPDSMKSDDNTVHGAEIDHKSLDFVSAPGCSLHGRLVSGDVNRGLMWKPIDCIQAVPVAAQQNLRIQLAAEPAEPRASATWEMTLVNGDAVPCEVERTDEERIYVRLTDAHPATVSHRHWKVLRTQRPEDLIYAGFPDGDVWFANSDTAYRFENDSLKLMDSVTLVREFPAPTVYRIGFDLHVGAESRWTVELGLGYDSVENALARWSHSGITHEMLQRAQQEDADEIASIVFQNLRGGRLAIRGQSRIAGILGMLGQRMATGRAVTLPLGDARVAHCEVLVDRENRHVAIRVNGDEVLQWRDATSLEGDFLCIQNQLASDSPSVQRRIMIDRRDGGVTGVVSRVDPPPIEISNFRIHRWVSAMDAAQRNRLLTRRLGTRAEATSHAVRATNGDVLRGRLIGCNDDFVLLESRGEELRLPTSRVFEIISLHPTDEIVSGQQMPQPDASEELVARSSQDAEFVSPNQPQPSTLIQLRSGGSLTLSRLGLKNDHFVGSSHHIRSIVVARSSVESIAFGGERRTGLPYAEWWLREPVALPEAFQSEPSDNLARWLDQPAPLFDLELLNGDRTAPDQLRGQPVLLDFWATWCGPCVASLPEMIELHREFDGKIHFVAMNVQEEAEQVARFLEGRQWQLPVALDRDGAITRAFGVNGIPCVVILDAQGIVRHIQVGTSPRARAELREKLRDMVAP
jgi:thiol-disulfide isomerase/thioredoxin